MSLSTHSLIQSNNKKRGFISMIVLIIGAFVLLKVVFNVDILELLQSPQMQHISATIVAWVHVCKDWIMQVVK
jgi:hypothetical protein